MVLVARGLTKSWMTELACEDSTRLPGRVGLTDHKIEPSIHQWPGGHEQQAEHQISQNFGFPTAAHRLNTKDLRSNDLKIKLQSAVCEIMNSRPVFPLPSHKLLLRGQELKLMPPAEHHTQVLGPWAHQHAILALTEPLLAGGSMYPSLLPKLCHLEGLSLAALLTLACWLAHLSEELCSSSGMPLCCPPPGQLWDRTARVMPWSHLNFYPELASCWECKKGSAANLDSRAEGHHSSPDDRNKQECKCCMLNMQTCQRTDLHLVRSDAARTSHFTYFPPLSWAFSRPYVLPAISYAFHQNIELDNHSALEKETLAHSPFNSELSSSPHRKRLKDLQHQLVNEEQLIFQKLSPRINFMKSESKAQRQAWSHEFYKVLSIENTCIYVCSC